MSSINDNGKGNICATYLFPSEDTIENINLEHKIRNEIGKVLYENGIKKFVVADDELIDSKILTHLENRFDDYLEQEAFLSDSKKIYVIKTHYDYDEVEYDSEYKFSKISEALAFAKGEYAIQENGEKVFKNYYEIVTEFFAKQDFNVEDIYK